MIRKMKLKKKREDEQKNSQDLNKKLENEQPIQRFYNDIPEEETKNIYMILSILNMNQKK